MKKIRHFIVYVFTAVLIVFFVNCDFILKKNQNTQKEPYQIPNDALVEIGDSTIAIKGKQLQLLDSLSNWVKILGNYDRKSDSTSFHNTYIWDSLGITVYTYGYEYPNKEHLVSKLNINLIGLDSPEAKAGKFEGARGYNYIYKDSLDLIERSIENAQYALKYKQKTMVEVIKDANARWVYRKEKRRWQNYPYPLRGFPEPLFINGVPINPKEPLKELNGRRKLYGLDLFSFIDRDNSVHTIGHNKTGETEELFEAYYYVAHPNTSSNKIPYRYKLKGAGTKVHYISVEIND